MNRRPVWRLLLVGLGLVALVVLGYLLSLYLVPAPKVAVIRIEGEIWSYYTNFISQALEEAGKDPAVRAVVLDIASPGGEVTASEDLYFDILKLRETKPVVVSVGELAASGAYYAASAADQIFAKPASAVGNIGVVSLLPEQDIVDEVLITTGPFKLSGGPQTEYVRQMELLKETFLTAVWTQRSDRLQVGQEVLSRGEIYPGLQAQRLGLVDEIGSQGDAIAAAARMARLRNYDTVDRTPEVPEDLGLFGVELKGVSPDKPVTGSTAATLAAPPKNMPPGFYYRYIEQVQ